MPIDSRRLRLAAAAAAVLLAALLGAPGVATAASYVPLNGDGSSWAEPAIDQWGKDVRPQGIVINFSGDGSATGRNNYALDQADFAASDIEYLTRGDPFGGGLENPNVAYSYIPIVAGGTSFMYNVIVGGRRVTNLRLSGETITRIFTGQIRNWNDPRITRDYGAALPSQPITVVSRSDGSGASYQVTRWMAKRYPELWNAFCAAHDGPNPCGPTEFFPGFTGAVQRGGSDQVANYISSPAYGPGAIGYDEYAYALNSNIPVVKLLNSAGYYSQPTASNVAIALQSAVIDNDPASITYLIQNLDKVYTNPDPRTYPLSSYSYLIVPRASRVINGNTVGPPVDFNVQKGQTLSTWLNYVLCGAQQKAGSLGYSPLPKNLVVGGFTQNANIPGHVPNPNLNNLNGCNNPTYHDGVNFLIRDAPQPSPCDKATAALTCGTAAVPSRSTAGVAGGAAGGGGGQTTRTSGAGTAGQAAGTSNGGGGGRTLTGAAGAQKRAATGAKTAATGSAAPVLDPLTGQVAAAAEDPVGAGPILAQPVAVTGASGGSAVFAMLTAAELAGAVVVPAVFGVWLQRRRAGA